MHNLFRFFLFKIFIFDKIDAMKKIIFLLLLPISVFAKGWDTIPRLMFKANPILLTVGLEKGILIEYKFSRNQSIEIAAGYGESSYGNFTLTDLYDPINQTNGNIFIGNEHVNFFSGRIGFRIYNKHGFYVSPVMFFRKYYFYDWKYVVNKSFGSYNDIPDPSGIAWGDQSSDESYLHIADERKLVVGFQFIAGWQYLIGGQIPFEIYTGIGVRMKERNVTVKVAGSNETEYDLYPPTSQSTQLNSVIPSIQFGIRIGFAFKVRKNKFYH